MKRITEMLRDITETGLSQSGVAAITGIPQPTISKWVNGKAPTSADHALSIQRLHSKTKRKPRTASPAQRDAKERA